MKNQIRTMHDIDLVLNNQHPLQTKVKVYQTSDTDNWIKTKNIGDIWTDKDGYKWEKIGNTTRSKIGKLDDIRREERKFKNCLKDKCTAEFNPSKLDLKFKHIHGMCRKCTAKQETKLKIEGKYDEYAFNKMKQNALSFIKEKHNEKNDTIYSLSNMSTIVRENGRIEKWDKVDKEYVSKVVNDDFNIMVQNICKEFNITEDELNEAIGDRDI